MARYKRRGRRLTAGGHGGVKRDYATTMGLTPVPFRRRGPPRTGSTAASSRAPRRDTRPRGPASLTKTKRKRRSRGGALKRSENSSTSSTRWGRPGLLLPSVYKKLVGKRIDRTSTNLSKATTQGTQAVTEFSWGKSTDLQALKVSLHGSSTALPLKMYVGYMKLKVLIKNQSNLMSRLTLYDIASKWQPMASTVESPLEMWQKGMIDFSLTNDETVPFSTPMRSPEFRKYYRIVKATTINMEPGQQHEHTIYRRFNWLGNTTLFDNAGTGISIHPFATHLLAVQVGGLVSGARAGGGSGVTVGVCQFDYLTTQEIVSALMPGTAPTYTSTAAFVTDITAPQFMGENSDVAMGSTDVPGGGGNA